MEGGYAGKAQLAELWAFSPDLNSWTELEQVGDKPGKRAGHIMVTRKESGETFQGFGFDENDQECNDVFRLKIGDNNMATWSRMHSK